MKRYGYIYEKVCDIDNIKLAIRKASKGKTKYGIVQKVIGNVDYYAEEVRSMLINKSFSPTPYKEKEIVDGSSGKIRTIQKPSFYPDQIIHWALMLQLEPILMKGMYRYNCGSVPGRGTSYGQKSIEKWFKNDKKGMKYCFKMDIKKFYPSIKHNVLKNAFRQKIKDKDCLWLIDSIIESTDDLPIGNYTSPWFANFLLQSLDHKISAMDGVCHYVRYVDDIVVFGANKRKLRKVKTQIESELSKLELKIKGNWQIFKTRHRPVDFLGFRFYPTHTTLRRKNALRIMRRMRKIGRKVRMSLSDAYAIISYYGWVKRSNSYKFYHKYFKPLVSLKDAKAMISAHSKGVDMNGVLQR